MLTTNLTVHAMAALWLLTLCVPLARGIAIKTEAQSAGRAAANAEGRARTVSAQALQYFHALNASSSKKPVLVPPGDVRMAEVSRPAADRPSLLGMDANQALRSGGEFQPSEEFQAQAEAEQGEGAALPWGIGTPRTGDNWVVGEWSAMHMLDVPKWVEYSLETGDNIQTFSNAWQDVKLITQVLENVTNGFYLDTHGGDGETNSYTLLLELSGWRGLIIEPQIYKFATLWGKMRKAWLFLGCLSPTANSTKIGFDTDGVIDMLSGHQIHAHPLSTFMEEMGGRKTIDFWALHNGNYEADVLAEALGNSGKNIEVGVMLIRYDGRNTGRGDQPYAQPRSKEATEALLFEVFYNNSFNYIGGLDAYWINMIEPRFHYHDHVWVNPAYFERRGLTVPTSIKSAPPPPLTYPRPDHLHNGMIPWTGSGSNLHPTQKYGTPTDKKAGPIPYGYGTPGTPYGPGESLGGGGGGRWDPSWNWDAGYSYDQEVSKMAAYIAKAKEDAAATESVAKAHRVAVTRLSSVESHPR